MKQKQVRLVRLTKNSTELAIDAQYNLELRDHIHPVTSNSNNKIYDKINSVLASTKQNGPHDIN